MYIAVNEKSVQSIYSVSARSSPLDHPATYSYRCLKTSSYLLCSLLSSQSRIIRVEWLISYLSIQQTVSLDIGERPMGASGIVRREAGRWGPSQSQEWWSPWNSFSGLLRSRTRSGCGLVRRVCLVTSAISENCAPDSIDGRIIITLDCWVIWHHLSIN